MWGQGQLSVQDMNLRESGEKGEKFKAVIFTTKNIVSMQNFTGSSMSYFHLSVWHIFVKKRIWKFFTWTFSKLLDDMKAIFEPIDLKFGIYIVNIYMTHILYGFLKIFIFKNFIEYLSLKLIFWKFHSQKFTIVKFWDSHFVHLIILRLLMFYNLKLLDNWMRCSRLNIGLILRHFSKIFQRISSKF